MIRLSVHFLTVISVTFCLLGAASANERKSGRFHAWVDFRTAYSTADREWLDGGFSKTRYGSVDGEGGDAELAEAGVEWKPNFNHALSGHFHLQGAPDQNTPVGFVEAFLRYRILPRLGWRISARLGRFFPPLSLENDGPGWNVTRTLTPSAINSWIGEEVAVVGGEVRAARSFGAHHLDFRLSTFGFNDTAGSLLSFRGWALHDQKTQFGGSFAIPDSDARRAIFPAQAERTDPSRELDGRLGFYGAVTWRYADKITAIATLYDNRGDPTLGEDGQYAWGTQFLGLGVKYEVTPKIEVLAQTLLGETSAGLRITDAGARVYDTRYRSAYILGSWRPDTKNILSSRFDYFETTDRTFFAPQRQEEGWAATLAWRHRLAKNIELGLESLYVEHDRRVSDADRTNDLQLQMMMRVKL